LQVRLFGDVSITQDDRSISIPSRKALELFCYLLIHRGRAHTREILMETLWPDQDPAVSKKYLRQALWRLNSTMQRRRTGEPIVVIDPAWVHINPDASCWVDVSVFERSYAATRDTPGHQLSDQQAHGLESALELYRGDLVATWYDDWCSYERDRLQQAYLAMLDQLMGHCESRGLYAKGLGHGQAVLRYDAAREGTHRQLMRLLFAAGDRASALRQYERCSVVLDQEFGIPPSADTVDLYEQIRAGTVNGVHSEHVPVPQPRPAAGNGHHPGLLEKARDAVMTGEGYPNSMHHVLAELARLDVLLARQVQRARRAAGALPDDGLTSFYIPEQEVDALLGQPAGGPSWDSADEPELAARLDQLAAEITERVRASARQGVDLRIAALAELFGLSRFDVDVVVTCLAPEIDRRYQRLYAYLHDDVTRRAPTVDLVLNLLCADVEARVAARARLSTPAPLSRYGLVTLADDPAQPPCSLLDKNIRLDPRIVRFLLGDDEPDERLRPYAQLAGPGLNPGELRFPTGFGARLARLADRGGDDLVLYCQGPYGVGKRSAAAACCRQWGAALLVLATDLLAARPAEEFATLLDLADREARLQGAVLYWDDADVLLGEDRHAQLARLLTTLAAHPAPAFLAGNTPWEPADAPAGMTFVRLEFPAPRHAERVRLWTAALAGTATGALDLSVVSGRFRLSGGQIRDAAATARNLAHARSPDAPVVTRDDLLAACRLQSNRKLAALAQQITPHYSWPDIVLPADQMAQLREIANQVRYRALVYEGWGFERKVAGGRGLAALFAGPSGTGKTMAADVLAHELGLDLYKIDLSTVVSKYIGETEKNLARIFTEAATSNAILFFDEADALFGKRSAVNDAHDRYANLEISYLLQKMEEHEGVVILATNLRKNIDEAFVRRLHVTIEFPVPGIEDRRRIWEQIWPAAAPRSADLDLELLARQIDLPGGNIRNIALAGAFLAAADGGMVTMAHLLQATRREYQKMGKVLTGGELLPSEEVRHAQPSV
jgi:DNA-binding SARP family transcriptional activator